jgi:hypothetical protein
LGVKEILTKPMSLEDLEKKINPAAT